MGDLRTASPISCPLSPGSCLLTPDPCLSEADPAAGDVDDAPPINPAKLLPAELLQPDELIILLIKPSAWFVILGAIRSLMVIALVAAALIFIGSFGLLPVSSRHDIVLFAGGCAGVRLFWQFLEWLSRVYVLTDRRVIRVEGVLRISVFESALSRIQHTSTTFSLRERLFGLGSIHFATAGTGIVEASWFMIARPLEVHRIVVQTLERYR